MNNEKYDDWFNEAFDEAFERAAANSPSVSHDTKRESWLQVKQKISANNKRRKRVRRFQFAAVIAASMATGAIFFSPPLVTQAVSPIYQQIKDWGNGIVTIVSGKHTPSTATVPKTPPPVEGADETVEENLGERLLWSSSSSDYDFTLEEVKSKITFPYPEFGYFPKDYQFKQIFAAPEHDAAPIYNMIVQYMTNEEKLLNVTYTDLVTGEVAVSTSVNPNPETILLKSGETAIYSEGSNAFNSIQFAYNNVLIHISGELSKKELLKMANSLP
ncbi:DUF4367 domain-containing protein [Paenibacillus dakarensis]|uniref:DUF4367 domain-containing protein n=1 Tax=Paenibacillus dakarensis TaxID=1527293 RepID=UPI0006D5AB2A|nr:DUF4367 domain-containing protein [Paenibacillus dakarensis]